MKIKNILLSLCLAGFISSCARAPVTRDINTNLPTSGPVSHGGIVSSPEVLRQDIIHEVGPGETVWRISKLYDVAIEDIAKANNLADITQLEKGQKLFIPNAAPLVSIIPLYSSNIWKYIIIHHSATDVGKALAFDYVHSHKRLWKGLGYHFVIDNGTSDKENGYIEISPRWLHQEYGAHCKADGMNYKAIGICLVGNFNEEHVSPEQMDSLVYLVKELKRYYNIPASNILGHCQVDGAKTDCPGKNFPWSEFRSRLKQKVNNFTN